MTETLNTPKENGGLELTGSKNNLTAPGGGYVKCSPPTQKKNHKRNVVNKSRAKKKTVSTTFRRWTAILCVRKRETKPCEEMDQSSQKVDGDAKFVEKRELIIVRGKPCARNRMPCDRRKMRKIHLFDPIKYRTKGKRKNEVMLGRAKIKVIKELTRQQTLGRTKPSPLEQAFLDAANENMLSFDYELMKAMVRSARFANSKEQKLFQSDVDAVNDNINIILNSKKPFVESDVVIALLHESLHNTVERAGKPGNPQLSEQVEHTAMALLGDRDEQQEYFQRNFNFDYVNESWMKIHQRKKRRRNPKYLSNVFDYEPFC